MLDQSNPSIPLHELPEWERNLWKRYWELRMPAGIHYPASITMEMARSAMRDPAWARLWMIPPVLPGVAPDLRHQRAYFLVPLLEQACAGEHQLLREEIQLVCSHLREQGRPLTDVFLMSHGWHRNFYAGVAAYDRLLAKFFGLVGRNRIEPIPGSIYIACHWHSDPGEDAWVDPGGRREKSDFIQRCLAAFEPKPKKSRAQLINALEGAFAFMSTISAPDVKAVSVNADREALKATADLLDVAQLRDWQGPAGGDVDSAAILTTLWGCFNETAKLQVLVDQSERARPVGSPWSVIRTIAGFAMSLGLPIGSLIAALSKPARTLFADAYDRSLTNYQHWAEPVQLTRGKHSFWATPEVFVTAIILLVYVVAIVVLASYYAWNVAKNDGRAKASKGWPVGLVVAWLPVQIIHTLPVLFLLLASWIFRTAYVLFAIPLGYLAYQQTLSPEWSWGTVGAVVLISLISAYAKYFSGRSIHGVFGERLRRAGDEPWTFRDYWAGFARWPINMVRGSVGPDSAVYELAGLIQNQLAFFELQRKGVDAGDDFGRFMNLLASECPDVRNARIHFIGHSFGGLVVLNAARRMFCAFKGGVGIPAPKRNKKLRALRALFDVGEEKTLDIQNRVTNVVLLQGAMSSDWLRGEQEWADKLTSYATIYSKYDTANGFWYPFANNGRLGAGYVGSCKTPIPPAELGKGGEFAMLAEPPKEVTLHPNRFLNLDASRIVFRGSAATGGGHDDIFKDDIVNLIWSVVQRT